MSKCTLLFFLNQDIYCQCAYYPVRKKMLCPLSLHTQREDRTCSGERLLSELRKPFIVNIPNKGTHPESPGSLVCVCKVSQGSQEVNVYSDVKLSKNDPLMGTNAGDIHAFNYIYVNTWRLLHVSCIHSEHWLCTYSKMNATHLCTWMRGKKVNLSLAKLAP